MLITLFCIQRILNILVCYLIELLSLVLIFALIWTLEARETTYVVPHFLHNSCFLVLDAIEATVVSMSGNTSIDLQFMQTNFGRISIIAVGTKACRAQRLVG